MGPFEVTKEMIAQLSDVQLRTLLSSLLAAEARQRGITPASIYVGGNQTAEDGGIDASIVWTGAPKPADWLPRRTIYFQCKAETMAAAKITDEMRPKGTTRPVFFELAQLRGSYAIFSTDDPSPSAYERRIAAMKAAVANVPNKRHIHFDFFGADRIARWTNQHLGVVISVLEQCGRSLKGWQPHGNWSAAQSAEQPYVFDEGARAVVSGTEMDVRAAIGAIRHALAAPGGAVRLVGISGMGKTRLAEALFDDRIDAESALAPTKAIYGDLGLETHTGAAVIAEELVLGGADAVVVIDNGNVRTHSQLAQIVSRPGSRSSLLSIDYDVGGEQPTGTMVVSLGNNSETVLMAVLEQRCPTLSQPERRHLAEFSGGNARIALKVAEGAGVGLDLATLNDTELLARLFQTGRQGTNAAARDAADAASLVYAFYVEAGDDQQAEHPLLAELAGIPADTYYRQIATFLDWGIVQQRGPQRAVMPPPLANMLAAPFIRRSDPSSLLAKFSEGPPRLFASFARRLGQLHNEPAAVRLVEKLFDSGGRLDDPAQLDDLMWRAFIQAAPGAPDAALEAIERSLAGPNAKMLTGAEPAARREMAQLLVFIAHEPVLFGRAMEALLPFVLHDHAKGPDEQMQSLFLERFWPLLSFTLADGATRLGVIDRLLDDGDERLQALGLESLDHMLDARHFSSSLNLEFGARPRLKEWRPHGADYEDWLASAFDRLADFNKQEGTLSERARAIVARHYRDHLIHRPELAFRAMRNARPDGFWDEGWRSASEGLHYDRTALTAHSLDGAEALEHDLRPKKIDESFEAFVLGEPWRLHHPRGRERPYVRNVRLLAGGVGRCLAQSGIEPGYLLGRAIVATGFASVWQFSRALARHTADPTRLWNEAYTRFSAQVTNAQNAAVMGGLLEGAKVRLRSWVDEQLDRAVSDPALSPHLVLLHAGVELDRSSMKRFMQALDSGATDPTKFSSLMSGGVTKPIPADALAAFLAKLFAHEESGLTALQILQMRMFGDRSEKKPVDRELVELGRQFLTDSRTYHENNSREAYDIAEIAKVVLSSNDGLETAVDICRTLIAAENDNRIAYHGFNQLCRVVMDAHPRAVLDEIVAKPTSDYLVAQFFGGLVWDDDDLKEATLQLDEVVALEWLAENPAQHYPRLARFVPYAKATDAGAFEWSPFARRLIDNGPDPVAVLVAFEGRFWSGGGSGPISARFVRRRPLTATFMAHENPAVRSWARRAGRRLEDMILRWEERDRRSESRFE